MTQKFDFQKFKKVIKINEPNFKMLVSFTMINNNFDTSDEEK
ncbi:hypothetical protein [Spiroplasma clarkii]|nr:hypothetical protein [Spiroplasma clarkii]